MNKGMMCRRGEDDDGDDENDNDDDASVSPKMQNVRFKRTVDTDRMRV